MLLMERSKVQKTSRRYPSLMPNPLLGHEPDLSFKVIFGSLPVLGSVPFLLGPHLRPVSRLLQARTPQERNRTRRADHRRATTPRPQSDSHQQATGTAHGKTRPRRFTLEVQPWNIFHSTHVLTLPTRSFSFPPEARVFDLVAPHPEL